MNAQYNEMTMDEMDQVNGGLNILGWLVGCVKREDPDDDESPVVIVPLEPAAKETRCKLSGGKHPLCGPPGCWDGPGGGFGDMPL